MTRPSIIRADTIDLQDHEAPSTQSQAKRRSLEPNTPGIDARDYIAPHQAETLREVAIESAEENLRSPRLAQESDANGFGHNNDNDLEHTIGGDGGYLNQAMDAYRQHEQGALAAAHDAGGGSSSDEDLDDDTELDDDMMDKISSSPSIEDEDIDFEFVYALHTFVATVEGQANATKGDTMVLLDDSNSYWWLVRVVKDSSIGYLPAEHIETPTERLARLNKHRNIDLSATMLGDQAPKQKSSFGILRKKKTVVFTDPTYVDYSDFDYSTDEEDIEELFGVQSATQQKQETQGQKETQRAADAEPTNEAAKVEPLRTKDPKEAAESKDTQDPATAAAIAAVSAASATQELTANPNENEARAEDDEDDDTMDDSLDSPSRSRNGTVRNTDSFYKDSSETKRITLTPNLLRDDSASSPPSETSSKDVKGRSSFETKMDKELVADKDKRKSKDKKPSAIRSFFSRKDKKRTSEDDDESFGKRSMDLMSDPRDSEDHTEDLMSPEKSHNGRPTGKLQKPQPRTEPSNARKVAVGASQRATVELSSYLSEGRTNDVSSVPPASMRIVDPETQESREVSSNDQQAGNRDRSGSTTKSPFSKIVPKRSPSGSSESKPQKTTKAKTRMELDVSSESETETNVKALADSPEEPQSERFASPGAAAAAAGVAAGGAIGAAGTAIASKTNASQMAQNNASNPPALVADTSSAEGRSPEASPSPELSQTKDGSTTSSAREQWNDLKLRAFFDESEHIRDLLAVVYDKSDVDTVGADNPIAGGLFREQNAKLAEITTQLDNLLGDWLARKQRLRGTV